MLQICKKSQEYHSKIYLFGAKPEIVEKAKQNLQTEYPQINIVGVCDGYCDESVAIEKIKSSNADILFVGLGSPKQEQFIIKNKEQLDNIKIFMPVGGSFDVISGAKKRAPKWMIEYNLEWLYRAFQEPKRVFRQLKLMKYIYLILTNKKGENDNE